MGLLVLKIGEKRLFGAKLGIGSIFMPCTVYGWYPLKVEPGGMNSGAIRIVS